MSAPQPSPSLQQSLATHLVDRTPGTPTEASGVTYDLYDQMQRQLVPKLTGLLLRPPRPQAAAPGLVAPRLAPLPSYNVATDGLQNGELSLGTAERPLSLPPAHGRARMSSAQGILRQIIHGAGRVDVLRTLREDVTRRPEVEQVARFVLGQALCRRAELRAAGCRDHAAYAPLAQLVQNVVEAGVDVCDERLSLTRRSFVGFPVELAALLHDAELFDLLWAHQRQLDAMGPEAAVQSVQIDLPYIALGSAERRAGTDDLQQTLAVWQRQARSHFSGWTLPQRQQWGHQFSLPAVVLRDAAMLREVLAWSAADLRMGVEWTDQLLSLSQDSFVAGLEAMLEVPGIDVNLRREGKVAQKDRFNAGPSALHVAAGQPNPELWKDAERSVDLLLAHGAEPGQLAAPSRDSVELLMPRAAGYFALQGGNVALFKKLERARVEALRARRASGEQGRRRVEFAGTLRGVARALQAWSNVPTQTAAVKTAISAATRHMLRDGELAAFASRRMTLECFSNALKLLSEGTSEVARTRLQLAQLAAALTASADLVATDADDGQSWGVLPLIRYLDEEASAPSAYRLRGALPVLVAGRDFGEAKLLLEHGSDLAEDDVALGYATALAMTTKSRKDKDDPALIVGSESMLAAFRTHLKDSARYHKFLAAAIEARDVGEVRALLNCAQEKQLAWWTSPDGTLGPLSLFADALRVGADLVSALVKALPAGQVAQTFAAQDAQGDTPLHLAARQGTAALAPLLRALRQVGSEPHEIENEEGRTPALEALAAGNVDGFRSLIASRSARSGRSTSSLLANALSGRAGKLTVAQLEAVASFDDAAQLLRQAAPTMLRRFARRGELGPIKTLLKHLDQVDPELQAKASLQAGLLHAVAESDAGPLYASLCQVLPRPLLLRLAEASDDEGLLPWQLAVNEPLRAQLRALAPATVAPAPSRQAKDLHVLAPLARLEAAIRGASENDVARERYVVAFLDAAARLEGGPLEPTVRHKLQGFAWRIVDQLACAIRGAGMGVHYNAHAPGLTQQELRQRAEANPDKSGSSCFAQRDGLTLLRLRAVALDRARAKFAEPQARPRVLIDLPEGSLGSYGYERGGPGGELAPFAQAAGIRFVVRPGEHSPQFISIYPVRTLLRR